MGMKIALINGSPKGGRSNSGFLLDTLRPLLPENSVVSAYRTSPKPLQIQQYAELCEKDVWILALPVYFDAVPSHLVRMMVEIERYLRNETGGRQPIRVYALINNGFYEGEQCRIAADIVRSWCERCNLLFGGAIGHGAGEMFASLGSVPLGQGPLKNLGRAMGTLADAIAGESRFEPIFISPNFPRFLWKLSATHAFWNGQARRNGLKIKEIRRKPDFMKLKVKSRPE